MWSCSRWNICCSSLDLSIVPSSINAGEEGRTLEQLMKDNELGKRKQKIANYDHSAVFNLLMKLTPCRTLLLKYIKYSSITDVVRRRYAYKVSKRLVSTCSSCAAFLKNAWSIANFWPHIDEPFWKRDEVINDREGFHIWKTRLKFYIFWSPDLQSNWFNSTF